MHIKKTLLWLIVIAISVGCQKEKVKTSADSGTEQESLTEKVIYSRKDTTSIRRAGNKATNAALNPRAVLIVQYFGEGASGDGLYSLSLDAIDTAPYATDVRLYRNGVAYEFFGYRDMPMRITRPLPPGRYYFTMYAGVGYYVTSSSFDVVGKPTVPSGMSCLYGYYNPVTGQHVCTGDWEELGSVSFDFKFEKVLGYTYPSASSAPNLKPIYRYYNPNTGSHYTTGIYNNYPGMVYEKILGYVGAGAGGNLTKPLTKYYNHFLDDHLVCVSPEVPQAPDYVADDEFIFGYVQ